MQIYRVFRDEGRNSQDCYESTLKGAHLCAKEQYDKFTWPAVRIELFDMPVDKDSMVGLLNSAACGQLDLAENVLRTWALTDRGGLKEVPNGE